MAYTKPEPLRKDHDREGFDCGEPALDEWLKRHAIQAQAADTARVFVTTDARRVVGYYALAAAQVMPAEGTERLKKGQPATRAIPAILLARLAVDRGHQGRGLGRSLLQDAMLRCEGAVEAIGARAMLVHAKNRRAREWYERFGFESSPTDPLHLVLLMKDLRALLRKQSLRGSVTYRGPDDELVSESMGPWDMETE